MVGAPSLAHYYNGGKACGECIQATGKKGTVTIRVVDSCPDCDKRSPAADLDLSEEAFQLVDDLNAGYVPITFQVVPCDVNGPMQYRFKDGSTQSWTAIQVLNNREPLSTFEYQNSKGTWVQMYLSAQSNSDSFFTASNGVGALNPLTVRITSVYGQVVVDTINVNIGNSAINSNTIFTGTQQFE
jgi:expansin (peptidoglycan-binding protein)